MKVNCPFCSQIIEAGSEECPNCGALFTEPDLKSFKFKSFGLFCALQVLTFGLFASLWFFINYNPVKNLIINDKDLKKFNTLIFLLCLSILLYFTGNFRLLIILPFIQYGIHLALTYRTLRIIQKHTLAKYSVELDFNPYYIAFFSVLYLVHYIDTYTDRVINAHDYFNFKSPQGVILVILLIIIAYIINLLNSIFIQII